MCSISLSSSRTKRITAGARIVSIASQSATLHASGHSVFAMIPEPSGQLNTAEVDDADSSCGTSTQDAVDQSACVDVAADAGPARRQLLSRVPANGEGEWQGVTDDYAGRRASGDGVCGGGIDDTRRDRLGSGMQQHVEV